jgi:NAD(P)-dependent dehydrogenase (short-subunit alcohol dehydrogenase family)
MGLLEGRVALITGASRGIGRAMSERFAREGAAVVCAARSGERVKETAAGITAAGGRAIAIVCDASVEDDVRGTVAIAVNEFGKLDTLVNNAGDAGPTKAVQDYLVEDWRYTIDSCLTSSYLCIRFAVPEMLKAGARCDCQHLIGCGTARLAFPHWLLLGEGWPSRHDIWHGARARPPQYPHELRGSRSSRASASIA